MKGTEIYDLQPVVVGWEFYAVVVLVIVALVAAASTLERWSKRDEKTFEDTRRRYK